MNLLDKAKSAVNAAAETTTHLARTASDKTMETIHAVTQTLSEKNIITEIRKWIASLLIKAIESCSTEQDRMDAIAWFAIAREILSNNELSSIEKTQALCKIMDTRRLAKSIFRGVGEAFENYKNAHLPLAIKVAIPVTVGAGTIVGGSSVGVAGFGSAIGLPVLLLIFLGAAGVTSILEAFLSTSEARDYISVVAAMIAKDELLRRANSKIYQAMTEDIVAPTQKPYKKKDDAIRSLLLNMDAYAFEKHIMSFFQQAGLMAWVTKKSNDAGVDGFARHPHGLIVVQCKRNAPENGVGRPTIQQFKGVIEENSAWRGYVVTTSYFTNDAAESAIKNHRLILVGMQELVEWHYHGIQFSASVS